MRRHAVLLLLAVGSIAACATGRLPAPSVPDDPSTVRVIVFMRNAARDELFVSFSQDPGGDSGASSGVNAGVAVACDTVPAGAAVAVHTVPGFQLRLVLYTAVAGDQDRVVWVDSAQDGTLTSGTGRPEWGSVDPQCS